MKLFEAFIYLNMDQYPHFLSFLYFLLVSVKIKNAIFILEFNYIILLDLNIKLFWFQKTQQNFQEICAAPHHLWNSSRSYYI